MSSAIVVAAADAALGHLLIDLLRSLKAGGTVATGVLDLGLSPEQRAVVASLADQIVVPGWDVDFPGRDAAPGWFRAMTARPFLPRHFPGHDIYLWLDADTWVQDFGAVDLFIAAAGRHGLAIVPEIDRAYGSLYGLGNAREQAGACYREAFGDEIGARLAALPILNTGAVALHRDSEAWAAWRTELAAALARTRHKQVEQAALNLVIYRGGVRAHYLPARCNWVCPMALPRVDALTGRLVEPYMPHQTLGIVHMTAVHAAPVALYTTDGKSVTRSLRYDLPFRCEADQDLK